MAKFLHTCKKGNKYLTKIIFKEGEGEKWATTSEAVYNWAKKNFKEDDEVDVDYNIKNGQYFVTKITKPGRGTSNTTPEHASEFVCEDCGKALKDGKYKKCYNCNKKSPAKSTGSEKSLGSTCSDCGKVLKDDKYEKCYDCNKKNPSQKSSPEKAETIARQNANHATSRALIALQGQIDVNNIFDISEKLHEMFLRLAQGK